MKINFAAKAYFSRIRAGMKNYRNLAVIALSAVLLFSTRAVCAGGIRKIYVGDIITLEIDTRRYTPADLAEYFNKFEIIETGDIPGGYSLTLRSFETGEHKILLGDNEIIIEISSVTEDIEMDGIFSGEFGLEGPGVYMNWRLLFAVTLSVFVFSGAYALSKTYREVRLKRGDPYKLFMKRCAALPLDGENFLVYLTYYFKKYVEGRCRRRIIGKTSAEIMAELNGIEGFGGLDAIGDWLMECDRMKFTGVTPTDGEKSGLKDSLVAAVTGINLSFGGGKAA